MGTPLQCTTAGSSLDPVIPSSRFSPLQPCIPRRLFLASAWTPHLFFKRMRLWTPLVFSDPPLNGRVQECAVRQLASFWLFDPPSAPWLRPEHNTRRAFRTIKSQARSAQFPAVPALTGTFLPKEEHLRFFSNAAPS